MGDEHFEARLSRIRAERAQAFATMGELHDEVVTRGVLPSPVRDEPLWPATLMPSLRVLGHGEALVSVISDGLSDPFDPFAFDSAGDGLGHRLEIFMSTFLPDGTEPPEPLAARIGAAAGLLAPVLFRLADWQAEDQRILDMMIAFDAITSLVQTPQGWEEAQIVESDLQRHLGVASAVPPCIGVLLFSLGEDATIPTTVTIGGERIAMIAAKVLCADEYNWARDGGNDCPKELARQFCKRGDAHLSWPGRPSVLTHPTLWRTGGRRYSSP
jgi:hypothetical protein